MLREKPPAQDANAHIKVWGRWEICPSASWPAHQRCTRILNWVFKMPVVTELSCISSCCISSCWRVAVLSVSFNLLKYSCWPPWDQSVEGRMEMDMIQPKTKLVAISPYAAVTATDYRCAVGASFGLSSLSIHFIG